MEQGIIEHYFNIIRRWLWLLVLAALAAGSTTYWLEMQQPPVYEAKVQLIVGPGIASSNPDLNELRTGGKLLQTYAELTTIQTTLQSVISNLDLNLVSEDLEAKIEVIPNEEAQILTIVAKDQDHLQAIDIANGVAAALVRLSPSHPDNPDVHLKDQIRTRVVKVEADIVQAEAFIEKLEADLQTTNNLEDQSLIIDQLAKERSYVSEANRTLALLYDSLQKAFTNQVTIVEPAVDSYRVNPQVELKLLISALASLVLILVIIFFIEYFDDSVKSTEDLAQAADVPVLGAIRKHKSRIDTARKQLIVQASPESETAEDYRLLSTKLLLSRNDHPLHSVLVSSLQGDEETGEIAANLAVVLTQAGQRVILVDANLRYPFVHHLFGINDQPNLSNALLESSNHFKPKPISWAPGLNVIPGAVTSSSPFKLLASHRIEELVTQLETQADTVLIVAPSLLSFADGLILASRVDGVVVVAHSGITQHQMVSKAVESLSAMGAYIAGTILNKNHESNTYFTSWRRIISKVLPRYKSSDKGKLVNQPTQ